MKVDKNVCVGCGQCINSCPVEAISYDSDGHASINKSICIGCGTCRQICPVDAISNNDN